MKHYILSTLCSAFIVPGLGQVMNGHLKKGLILLSVVFLLFAGVILSLARFIYTNVNGSVLGTLQQDVIVESLRGQILPALSPFILAFAALWIYSVIDAFWFGKRMDNEV